MNFLRSVRMKLLLCFLVILIISSAAISIVSYRIAVKNLKEKVSDSYEKTLELVANNVRENISQIQRISDFIYVNDDVKALLGSERGSYENIKRKEELTRIFTNSTISNFFKHINTIKIADKQEIVYTYVSDGQYDVYDNSKIIENLYFQKIVEHGSMSFQAMTGKNNGFLKDYVASEASISLFRPICDEQFSHVIGVMFIDFNPEIFENCVGYYGGDQEIDIKIYDNQNRLVYSEDDLDGSEEELISNAINSFRYEDHDRKQMVFCQCTEQGWKIVGRVNTEQLIRDNKQILVASLTGIAIAAILTVAAWSVLSYFFLMPLRELKQAMKRIRNGNFDVRARVLSRDELGDLTEDFNYMVDQITRLFEKQMEDQSKLKDAEYMALQAQINPHFLYNTLNSIRWLAIIQKADNIKEVVDALVRLLRSTTGHGDMETVEQCVLNLKSYAYIQQMAYRCKFEIKWEVDHTLAKCQCMKFLLQPLVENAIYHGIEPKDGPGLIKISIRLEMRENKNYILFEVWDNGVGISKERMKNYLTESDNKGKIFSGIGVKNVDERLAIMYGEESRLHIESEEGSYCKVWFMIPKIEEGDFNV